MQIGSSATRQSGRQLSSTPKASNPVVATSRPLRGGERERALRGGEREREGDRRLSRRRDGLGGAPRGILLPHIHTFFARLLGDCLRSP